MQHKSLRLSVIHKIAKTNPLFDRLNPMEAQSNSAIANHQQATWLSPINHPQYGYKIQYWANNNCTLMWIKQ